MTEATRLAEIQKRLEAATKGPWECSKKLGTILGGSGYWIAAKGVDEIIGKAKTLPDALFLASAPDDIRYLLDRIRELEAAPKDTRRGYQLWLTREQWGFILDGLIEHAATLRKRKGINPASTSDETVQQVEETIRIVGDEAQILVIPPDLEAAHGK